jgi:hypothetical protein
VLVVLKLVRGNAMQWHLEIHKKAAGAVSRQLIIIITDTNTRHALNLSSFYDEKYYDNTVINDEEKKRLSAGKMRMLL